MTHKLHEMENEGETQFAMNTSPLEQIYGPLDHLLELIAERELNCGFTELQIVD